MNRLQAEDIINKMGPALRSSRVKTAIYFRDETKLLLQLVLDVDNKNHHKAAWLLEILVEKEKDLLNEHIHYFANKIKDIKNQSAVRPIAKICRWLSVCYLNNSCFAKDYFNETTINQIIETSFDWMIGDFSIATKVYTMDTLYNFGCSNHNFKWVLEELKLVIEQQMYDQSPGFQAHGQRVIEKIKTFNLNKYI